MDKTARQRATASLGAGVDPVPAPRFVDENGGVLAYPLIPGQPLIGRAPAPGTARWLGQFLRDLHTIDPTAVAGLVPTEDADPKEWLGDLDGSPDLVSLLHATVPPPARQCALAHADLVVGSCSGPESAGGF